MGAVGRAGLLNTATTQTNHIFWLQAVLAAYLASRRFTTEAHTPCLTLIPTLTLTLIPTLTLTLTLPLTSTLK